MEGSLVELNRTAFYYTSGGQPNDTGKIICNGSVYQVLDVYREKESGRILHKLDRPLDAAAGGPNPQVHGVIDWERRHMHMRHHTALHILSRVVLDEFGNFVTSSQIYADRSRIDFDSPEMPPDKLKLIEEKTNAVIKRGLPVSITFISREEALKIDDLIRTKVSLVPEAVRIIRVVVVEGFDRQACGGTHVANTSEIGTLKITKTESKGRERRRIEIALI